MNDVYKDLMDLDLILQDGDKMVALKLFLGSVDPTSPSLVQLHSKIREFTVLVERLVGAAEKACYQEGLP